MLLDAPRPRPAPERLARCLASLPAAKSPADTVARVAGELHREGAVLVVLADEPPDSLAVADAPLLLRFRDDDLAWALSTGSDVIVALTNSRALPKEQAVAITRSLAERLAVAARKLGADPRVVSCGEATLRDHFPAEATAVVEGLRAGGEPAVDGVLLCPAVPEAGRVTIGGVHCLHRNGQLVPVAETELAVDSALARAGSDLRDWAAERAGIPRERVAYVNLADIRLGGAARVAELLCEARDGQLVVLDAESREDLEVLAIGVAEAECHGRRFVSLAGPSFVSARAGRTLPAPRGGLVAEGAGHGLVVVGSPTELTRRQLARAVARHGLARVELDVAAVADPCRRDTEIARATAATADALACADVALARTRSLADDAGVAGTAAIAAAVVAVVQRVVGSSRPRFLLTTGGIDVQGLVRTALRAGRATVRGQLLSRHGSVWRLEDGPYAGLPCVICPGEAGDGDALVDALARLRPLALAHR